MIYTIYVYIVFFSRGLTLSIVGIFDDFPNPENINTKIFALRVAFHTIKYKYVFLVDKIKSAAGENLENMI